MKTPEDMRSVYLECIKELAKPVVRFCVRHTFSYQDCISVLKNAFIEVAMEELKKSGSKVNVSRISAVTGLIRKDVTHIYKLGEPAPRGPLSIAARVISLWENDKQYQNKNRKPRNLSLPEFQDLVSSVSQHINAGTVLFELERSGMIERKRDSIVLAKKILQFHTDPKKGAELVSQDMQSLMDCAEENLFEQAEVANLHIRTEYDNLSEQSLKTIRKWFIAQGKALHRKARKYLSKYDLDVSPSSNPSERGGCKASITMFTLTSPLPTRKSSKK